MLESKTEIGKTDTDRDFGRLKADNQKLNKQVEKLQSEIKLLKKQSAQ